MGMVFGFKLHALTSVEGLFERWAFAAANHADVTLAKELMEGLEEEVIVGDKAYIRHWRVDAGAVEHDWG